METAVAPPATPPAGATPQGGAELLHQVRSKLQIMRKELVQRSLQRHSTGLGGRAPAQRPATFPRIEEPGKMMVEAQVAQLIATALLDPATVLPLELSTLHKRLERSVMGDKYIRALAALDVDGPQLIIARMAAASNVLDAWDLELGPVGGGANEGEQRLWITDLDRQGLARFAGVEDPVAVANAAQAMLGGAAAGAGLMPPVVVPGPQGGLGLTSPSMMPSIAGGPGGMMGGPGAGGMPPVQLPAPPGFPPGGPGPAMPPMPPLGGMGPMQPQHPPPNQMPGIMMPPGGHSHMGGSTGSGPGGQGGPGGMPSIMLMPPMHGPGMGGGLPPQHQGGNQFRDQHQGFQQQQQQGFSQQGGPGQQGYGDGGGGGVGSKRGRSEGQQSDDLESLLTRKTTREQRRDKSDGGELVAVLTKPSAREAAALEQFRTAGGASAIQEHCPHLTKADCRRANNSAVACPRVHFRRLIFPHTDTSLGNCSYLNTCRNYRNCKYVHYEIDDDEPNQQNQSMPMSGALVPGSQGTGQRPGAAPHVPKYLQSLQDRQWIKCDIRTIDMTILGKFGVIMADPPWQIHQDLPYGTMEDDEMRRMNIGCLQDDGVIFLWVTGRAMELGRECLKLWGYDRVDELIWVKTNQLNRLIRTGRTGHWLNHSKEHCLVGLKGNPQLNRYVDCDVVVAEVRETSRKPDEMYALLERLSPGTRKLEIFARPHNLQPGWIGLGNQLPGVQIVDPDLRERYIARYGPPAADGTLPPPN